ncbi:BA14K family protein [Afifella sp. IM 167]|uniref:BA14K family protein n=1 Tax=Afifella sp. IM 167 TaxID=2033586 RepID=UPI001CCA3D58|nr:BA14K family protein [Afifella sp. IM 167]MBZ8135110.1 hypothetical protein [Afifella sp. IM 167]
MRKLTLLLSAGLLSLGLGCAAASAASPIAPAGTAIQIAGGHPLVLAQWGPPGPPRWGPPPRRWRGPPPRRWRGPPPRRFGPPPVRRYYGAPRPWTPDWYAYCSSKYRSFDPRSGTYQPYNGPRRLCR